MALDSFFWEKTWISALLSALESFWVASTLERLQEEIQLLYNPEGAPLGHGDRTGTLFLLLGSMGMLLG